jgi:hypothetical protein
MVLGLPGLH